MMNDLDRLRMLDNALGDSGFETAEKIGKLANDIESIRSLLDGVSDEFSFSFSKLWAALEIVGVKHQEEGTEPTEKECADLEEMKNELIKQTGKEIAARGG